MASHSADKMDFLLAGVGGQGIVLASDLLGEVGLAAGYDVKKSDVFGMAQRGGSVVSQVRLGPKVYSPLPPKGKIDYLLALEKLEAARWVGYLRPGGIAVVNDHRILPLSVSAGAEAYPEDSEILAELRSRTDRVFLIKGSAMAQELGNPRVLNLLMLGFLSSFLPIPLETWRAIILQRIPAKYVDLNLRALDKGRGEAERYLVSSY